MGASSGWNARTAAESFPGAIYQSHLDDEYFSCRFFGYERTPVPRPFMRHAVHIAMRYVDGQASTYTVQSSSGARLRLGNWMVRDRDSQSQFMFMFNRRPRQSCKLLRFFVIIIVESTRVRSVRRFHHLSPAGWLARRFPLSPARTIVMTINSFIFDILWNPFSVGWLTHSLVAWMQTLHCEREFFCPE